MARKLALLQLALLVALFLWRRSSPEPVPVAIFAPAAQPVRAQALEVEASETAAQPSRAEVLPDPETQTSSALPKGETDADSETRSCVHVLARDTQEFRTQGPRALRAGAPGGGEEAREPTLEAGEERELACKGQDWNRGGCRLEDGRRTAGASVPSHPPPPPHPSP